MGRGGVLTGLELDCIERYSALLREPEETQDELINETFPLFLECGRQLSPQFRDEASI